MGHVYRSEDGTWNRVERRGAGRVTSHFGDRFPTSALIGVSALMVPGALIEIEATAVLNDAPSQ